ncbi:YjjG family noncanonical pyrimidine nucleotidase [Aurantibacter sp.]|uniref:YjjG family noncanonical pyrimidine nucleotidase n=1 Tax=Aurantibacter sp. TaxID=2807103 RepID=UPI0035C7F18B
MTKNTITDVFFDLDHTLWDFDKNSKLTFKYIFEKHKVQINLDDFIKIYEPTNLKFWKLFREEKISKKDLRYRRLKEVLEGVNYFASDNLIHQLSEDYITYLSDNNYLFDGTLDILEYLKPNYNLHIITNGFSNVQDNKMNKSGLAPYFKTLTDAETVGVKKPNPDIFNYAINKANTKVENSIMIGDSLEADIEGALNIGLKAIYFNPKKESTLPNIITIDQLLQLKKHL